MSKKSQKQGSSKNSSRPVIVQSEHVNWTTKFVFATATLNFGSALIKFWQDHHADIVQFFHVLFRLKFHSYRRRWMSRHLLDLFPVA